MLEKSQKRIYLDHDKDPRELSDSEKWWLAIVITLCVLVIYILIVLLGPFLCDFTYSPSLTNNSGCSVNCGSKKNRWFYSPTLTMFGILLFAILVLIVVRVIFE